MTVWQRAIAVGWMAAASGPALAHHPTGGATPGTAWDGLVSGLAHPIIGLDHAAFVIGIGILSAFVVGGSLLPALFLAAGAVGVSLHLAGATIPAAEILVGATVVAMAAAVAFRRLGSLSIFGLLGLAGGLLHGYALAESIVGAERTPLAAYMLGLIAVQLALALAVREGTRRFAASRPILAARGTIAAAVAILLVGVATQLA